MANFSFDVIHLCREQAVLQEEIYATNDSKENAKVFGYQERYAEYRYKPSTIVGKLRSNAGGSLDAWHLSQFFGAAPTNQEIKQHKTEK
jgi:hypothetical protein